MRVFPDTFEAKTGFDKIREMVAAKCLSSLGTRHVEKMKPSDDLKYLKRLLTQTEELRRLFAAGNRLPDANYIDPAEQLAKMKVSGTYLEEEEAYDLKRSLSTIMQLQSVLSKHAEECPTLYGLSGMVDLPADIIKWFEAIIDDTGKLRANASKELMQIRASMVSEHSSLRRVMDHISKDAQKQGWSPDDGSIAVRGGRLVIPVLAEHKRKLKGFIHDESATGQTVFMEPAEALEINNRIRELELEERREIIRILRNFTDQLRPHIPALEKAYHFLGAIDFIRAKALLAIEINGLLPVIDEKPVIVWHKAVHPLLYLLHKKAQKPIVPLDIELDAEKHILIISGPNAGGKSVCLKTVVLLQYMLQCGLLVPVRDDSVMGVFNKIFIDMGDEQSLENDLSTYSSHLTSMRFFLENAGGKTLFLIDEFGAGTEPQFGGAIAEGVLEQLYKKQSFGVITTHYGNLKSMAEKNAGIINGAMRYDVNQLKPLYELEVGRPGSSFALEMAANIGLSNTVIERAKSLVGHSQVKFETLINELEAAKNDFQTRYESVNRKNTELEKILKDYQDLKAHLDGEKSKIIKEAKQEAKRIVLDANKAVENTIREIKENKAEKEKTKEVRQKLTDIQVSLTEEVEEKKPVWTTVTGEIKVGDKVRMAGQESAGEVVSIRGKKAEVLMGELKSHIALNRLEKVKSSQGKKSLKRESVGGVFKGIDMNQRRADFSPNLDLRGKRADEAIQLVDDFIDSSVLFSMHEVRIVHGKGDGILREVIRRYLSGNKFIQRMADEHVERGGSGVTVICFRQ
ncbi:Smr/MutS family protein [uncultured Imperialibacter sp.]|uniref:endonuclease MutS2 n=1 Tax=uncultured Imperialibacter sp. TaxID=1672639 RepID=UPI0030DCBD37|tara:strand:- start:90598 stop:92994 length:2397 start_codon:yes stop_codon:yes gene_type:complete